jgi:ATP-binding cassette subfamily B multidrug efflux pump
MERWIDRSSPAPIIQPPGELVPFYRHFLAPMKGLIVVTLFVSLVASVIELSMFAFLGSLVDRMAASGPGALCRRKSLAPRLHGLCPPGSAAAVDDPLAGLVNLSLAPNLSTLVRWQSYRYVLRQSLGFFQNDFSGRISQKVMQTGMAVRESVVNIVDGVWYLAVYVAGTVAIMVGFDWRLLLPLAAWTAAYAVVVVTLVPPVRDRAAAMSEANSGLTGRVVDGFTNILSVKLFAHAEREEAFGREAFEWQLDAARAMNRTIVVMTAALTIINSVFISPWRRSRSGCGPRGRSALAPSRPPTAFHCG